MIYNIQGNSVIASICFDTIADLKAAAIRAGDVVMTLGYYAASDGGAAFYSVREKQDSDTTDGYSSFEVSGLFVSLVDDGREINVLQWGMKPDGTTDNLPVFNAIQAAQPARTLYFPKGVYAFAGAMVFDRCYMRLDNAELLCTGSNIWHFIEIRGQMYPLETPQDDMFIRGNGTVNANFNASNGITVARQKHTVIEGIHIKNFKSAGIHGKNSDTTLGTNLSYELEVKDCLISNELSYASAIGIYDTGDSSYSDTVILNVKTAISATGSSVFHNIHAWCFDFDNSENRQELMEGTTFAVIRWDGTRFSDCYCDTYQKAFTLASRATQAFVSNLKWFINSETWPDDLVGTVFNTNPDGKAAYKVFGALVPSSYGTKFCDVDPATTDSEFFGIISGAVNAPK